jgi:hypothetical protein
MHISAQVTSGVRTAATLIVLGFLAAIIVRLI